MPLDGTQLGHYRLLRLIGSGGMGEVYLAEDTRIHRQVAIKVVRAEATPYPDAHATKEATRLFQREMRAVTTLDHPHILSLFDFGEETVDKATFDYMVMPYRQEGSLADWLQQRTSAEKLSPEDVAHFIYQAADALQHAHDHQLIHQDVKPSNFLIRSRKDNPHRPDVLLADFGIAKFTTATATASQSSRGTPAYMSPEQWDGQPVAATDQYALAVMAYQLLTGRPPFLGGQGHVMRQHFNTQPQPPSTLNPDISPAIDAVILRALEKQAEDRFASVADFAQAFQEALQGRGDLHAPLAISEAETRTGTTRTLTLPGGRQLTVTVPASTQDGHIIHLEGQGQPYYTGGPMGALVLTITVVPVEEAVSTTNTNSDETPISSDLKSNQKAMQSTDGATAATTSSPYNTPSSSAIHATLAISDTEALSGTSRTLTLPEGQQVSISVPAGAYDGEVLYLENQGSLSSQDGQRGTVILTLAIIPTQKLAALTHADFDQSAVSDAPTVISSQNKLSPDGRSTTTDTSDSMTIRPRRGPFGNKAPLVIGLAILVILMSIGALLLVTHPSGFGGSTPTKTLDTFCGSLKSGDFDMAYSQLSGPRQTKITVEGFRRLFTSVRSCTFSSVKESDASHATATITFLGTTGGPVSAPTDLVLEQQTWKIDAINI